MLDLNKIMNNLPLSSGTVHDLPDDLKRTLDSDRQAAKLWQSLTPLARNEWICWTISVKQQKTRDQHIERVISELKQGMRRPCCWIGCIHRTDKAISPSVKGILAKRTRSR